MEHYPDIQRHQGTLFFIPHGDRAAIGISIERLIDLLDAMGDDPDAEDGGDLEPSLGALENHLNIGMEPRSGDQTHWGHTSKDDREDDGDDLEDGADAEPSLGAANDYVCRSQELWSQDGGSFHDECEVENEDGGDILDEPHDGDGDDEPDLGWSGHGTGWRIGDDPRALEASQLGSLELELDEGDDAAGFFAAYHGGHRSLGVDATLLPDEFNCTCEGDCLEPLVANGARLHFDKRMPVHFDRLVMIVRKPGTYPKGEHQAVVKRLIADLRGIPWQGWEEGGIIAEMLNPHRTLFYPAHTVQALIACTGPASETIGPRITAGNMLALRATTLAAGRSVC